MKPEKDNDGLTGDYTIKSVQKFRVNFQCAYSFRLVKIFRGVLAAFDIAMEHADDF
jgi:hypothetical protein